MLLLIYPHPYITIDVTLGFIDESPSVPCEIVSEVPLVLVVHLGLFLQWQDLVCYLSYHVVSYYN